MFKKIKYFIKNKIPATYLLLHPLWVNFYQAIWNIRNIILINAPIKVHVNNDYIEMLPQGHIAEVLWKYGFENLERKFVVRHLRAGMCVVNIGANAGLYSLIAGRLVGSKGQVHAFEPSKLNFELLNKNITLNTAVNIHSNRMAISNFEGNLALYLDPENPKLDSHYFVRRFIDGSIPEDALEIIKCITLDKYWADYCGVNHRVIDFIILDVEGSELAALEGMTAILEGSPRLIMMIECTKDLEEIDFLLKSLEFNFYLLKENTGEIEEIEKIARGNVIVFRKKYF